MRQRILALAVMCMIALPALRVQAEGEAAGDFDYFVMSLGWSSNWCALEGDRKGDPQCDAGRNLTWTLHGLWPQYEDGYPSYCRTSQNDPSRAESEAMADIMGGSGLAWYQWKKHGRCAGLPAKSYYATMRKAFASVTIPPLFANVSKDLQVPAEVIEKAWLESNPNLNRDQITVTCKAGMIQEVRICLTPALEPRRCGADVIRDCTLQDADLQAIR